MTATTSASAPGGSSGAPSEPREPSSEAPIALTHKQILEVMTGLLLGMLTAIISSTVVSTSLPKIVGDLGGSQSSYTWIVTASLLSMTVSTPIWGKLADLTSRKVLIQLALVVFVAGSVTAGFSQHPSMMIACRVLQGIGMGGLTALAQVILSDIVSPRQRGRYMGYFGAVMAVGTVSGPLVGGLLTDSVGWRWNFFVCVPLAIVSLIVLQATLHLPSTRRKVSIDYLGAVLLSAGVAGLLIWVSLAGQHFAWWSTTTAWMVGGSVAALVLAIVAETRAKEPILPLFLFRNRTFVLAIIASITVGVAMFGTSVFLSQYMQLARGKTPTDTGLLTIPMAVGSLLSATIVGRIITRTGKWKRWMVLGAILLMAGVGLMGTIDSTTSYYNLGAYMLLLGLGVGMCMQNLVLAVQNTIPVTQMGAASAGVAFFRSMGGAIGVSALGAVMGSRVESYLEDGFRQHGIPAAAAHQAGGSGGQLPDVTKLPPMIRGIVESAFGDGVADIFLVALPVAAVAFVAILLIREIPLGTRSGIEQRLSGELDAPADHVDGASGSRTPEGLPLQGNRRPDGSTPAGVPGSAPAYPRLDGAPDARLDGGLDSASGEGVGDRAIGAHVAPALTALDTDSDAELVAAGAYDGTLDALEPGNPHGNGHTNGHATNGHATNGRTVVGDIVGAVRTADGHPVPGAALTLIDAAGREVVRAFAAEDGSYQLGSPAVGSFVLVVGAQRRQPAAARVTVRQGGRTHRDIRLGDGAALRGTARRAGDRRPIADALVRVIDADGRQVAVTTTDDNGEYVLDDVPAGEYTLIASGYPAVRTTVRLVPGAENQHHVDLGYPDGQ